MKDKLIKYIHGLEANYGLHNFVESYRDPKNSYFRVIKILRNRYGYIYVPNFIQICNPMCQENTIKDNLCECINNLEG